MTFGDLVVAPDAPVLSGDAATVSASTADYPWRDRTTLIRWDTPGAFTHSLTPSPAHTLARAMGYSDDVHPEYGAEYLLNNSSLRNTDVRFTVTARSFAIRYVSYTQSEAMVWIDGRPARATPIAADGVNGKFRWIRVDLPTRRTVSVRFAGPMVFTGVDHDAEEPIEVRQAEVPLTLGIVADSFYEQAYHVRDGVNLVPPTPMSAAPMLGTLTGFRVWNMAENGTGYVNDGSSASAGGIGSPPYLSSPFGSDRRMDALAKAPIDALLVNGSLNDVHHSAADHRVAVDRFLDEVARRRPDLPVVLVGIEPIHVEHIFPGSRPHLTALNDTLRAAADRHPNVVGFVDPFEEAWLTGTGSTASPRGDGNQDRYVGPDGIHLGSAGQAYYQARIVEQLRLMRLEP